MTERTRCPACGAIACRVERKAAGSGGRGREQVVQPPGGDLPPGPVFHCVEHGVFVPGTVEPSPKVRRVLETGTVIQGALQSLRERPNAREPLLVLGGSWPKLRDAVEGAIKEAQGR